MIVAERRAFSDIRFEIVDVVVAGDRVIVWATMHGTHTGDGWIPPKPRYLVRMLRARRREGRLEAR